MTIAYAWRSGKIGFGSKCPGGAIPILSNKAKAADLRRIVETLARHGYKRGELLVPGIPEAGDDDEKAMDALIEFQLRVEARLEKVA